MKLTAIEQQVADRLGHWYTHEYRSGGWYECLVTGKKKRGLEVKYLMDKQAKFVAELEEEQEYNLYADEPQGASQEAIGDPDPIAVPENEPEPTKGKRRARGQLSLEDIQKKYPHVTHVHTIEISQGDLDSGDHMGLLQTKFPHGISDKLADWLCQQMNTGKSSFVLYEIQCQSEGCRESRIIKPQDAFQAKRCQPCTIQRKNEMRRRSAR